MPTIPIWSVALVLAIFAPLLVRLYAEHLDRQARGRTEALLATLPRARAAVTVRRNRAANDGENGNDVGAPHTAVGGDGRSAPH